MITGHAFIACSLDGFIARPDHALDWLTKQPVGEEDHGYDAFVAGMDGIVMGSASFRTVMQFPEWPYAKPVVVLSKSLDPEDIPEAQADSVRLSRASPTTVMQGLADEGWNRVYVDGGAVIQSFLRAGLIAELTITHVPILLGAGRRLFGPLEDDIDLTLMESRHFRSGLLSSKYRVIQAEEQA